MFVNYMWQLKRYRLVTLAVGDTELWGLRGY